ncbi:MAG: hypothetical protein AAFN78_19750, partial [Pseudomonadota bacterium]
RMRDASGSVTNYTGQNVEPMPVIVLADDANETALPPAGITWLNDAANAPEGYFRYADDAVAASFTMPDTWDITEATPLVLQVTVADASNQQLDADPATPVDWSAGHWTGYQSTDGAPEDLGGSDCGFKLFAAPTDMADAPATDVTCPAAVAATPPPAPAPAPAPAPTPAAGGGGGGGAASGLLLAGLALLILVAPARRRTHV